MKILIIGSKGMLGIDLVQELSKTDYKILGWDIPTGDMRYNKKFKRYVNKI